MSDVRPRGRRGQGGDRGPRDGRRPNNDKPTSGDEIIRRTKILLGEHPATQVLVKADRAVPYGNVIGAMVLLQRAGADKVGFVTDPLDTYPIPE